ncbi:hypothetical protein Scep_028913 [Stephania cephalantha]|uniref:Cystatin domain-containing protein n=1 Tax=Stephania cephalantha TaxID=152367 RepID=A0AAP0EAT3_9MAGN
MFTPLLLLLSLLLFHTSFAQIRVGGFQPVDPKDPHVVEIARFAVDEHNKQAHTNLVFLEVFGAESQIVKGRNFKLTIELPMEQARAIPWVGGFQPIDPKDAHVIEVARFAVDAYNKQAHTNLGFLIVVEGESQVVVLGTNYNLTIRVYNGGLTQTYVVFVYEPLRGQKELKSFKIINGVGNKLGGFKLVDPRDPHIVEIGRYAVDEYNKQAHKSLVFKSVIQAQVQIVNGRNYKVTIRVADGGTYEALVYEALNGQKTLNGPLKVKQKRAEKDKMLWRIYSFSFDIARFVIRGQPLRLLVTKSSNYYNRKGYDDDDDKKIQKINEGDEGNIYLHKSRGQHILTNPRVLDTIVRKADVAQKVVAIEIEKRMVEILINRASNRGLENRLSVICKDALKTELPQFDAVVANIPYGISSPLIAKFVFGTNSFRSAILLLQKEFARRLLANPGDSRFNRLAL